MIVVDTNIIAYFFIPGENTQLAKTLLKKDSKWVSPILWRSEFRNILALYIRKNYLSLSEAKLLIEEAERLMSGSEFHINSNKVLDLANRSQCSAYDCEFVALAMDLNLPLITSDKQLIREFPEIVFPLKYYIG